MGTSISKSTGLRQPAGAALHPEKQRGGSQVTDAGATLGRVLFYDKPLSVDNTVSCASCHQQELAFGDDDQASVGVAGVTPRHSMRLVNVQYAEEVRFFWDERAANLEDQTTQPIQDHLEMGFSGTEGDPDLADLLAKLEAVGYYRELFTFVFGDTEVTEARLQNALSQFLRSIRSFDSKYDEGRLQTPDDRDPLCELHGAGEPGQGAVRDSSQAGRPERSAQRRAGLRGLPPAARVRHRS